ncbi:hypothetical protein PRIPAC_84905 [Pristionchus pacificus]|uniref:Uncharacterized protein n=1 Tax=Pristionchus pacificus TaxID=54126 RepID=A0A454XM22_PRIPA|nr:hypothetical protein PRIPAC_84905 [Pristionchus pacificus]|eukprot:PDM66448.1 hypothetical protein PRIPAC_47865 [Pristionchus pacificus]
MPPTWGYNEWSRKGGINLISLFCLIMSLSRCPSSATFVVEKRKKIGCFSGFRPVFTAIRSVLPGRRIPRHSSSSSYYVYLPAPSTIDSADIVSRPLSPYYLIDSDESIGLNDNIVEDDNYSLRTIDIFNQLESTRASRDIFSRPPSPSQESIGLDGSTVDDDNVSRRTIDIFNQLESLSSEPAAPAAGAADLISRPSSTAPSIPSESSWIDGLLEEDSEKDSISSNELFDGPINFDPLSSQSTLFRLVTTSY